MEDLPILFSVVGADNDGSKLRELVEKNISEEQFIFTDNERPTTVKMRTFVQNRQVSRADFESCKPVNKRILRDMEEQLSKIAPTLSAIIIEDYNKGLLTQSFIKKILDIAGKFCLKVLVDPKLQNFFSYKGVTLFKPNLRELSEATSMHVSTADEICEAATKLREKLDCQYVMVTMGKDGVCLVDENNDYISRPAFVRIVNDPAGAGDTVISIMASAMASGASAEESMVIANYGGGLICEKVGIQSITSAELSDAIMRHER